MFSGSLVPSINVVFLLVLQNVLIFKYKMLNLSTLIYVIKTCLEGCESESIKPRTSRMKKNLTAFQTLPLRNKI